MLSKGSTGPDVRSLQEVLNFLHFEGRLNTPTPGDFIPLVVDGVFGDATEDAVMQFQKANNLYSDGKVGPITLGRLQAEYNLRSQELNTPLSIATAEQLSLEVGPADKYGEGYAKLRLRSDVMAAYRQVYDAVHAAGGILTTTGGIRDLDASVNPNRSATSFHYTGRALDLFIWSGMKDPNTDPYVVQRIAPRKYNVFARCDATKAQDGALPQPITIPNAVSHRNRVNGISVTGHFLDLTALFAQHGFHPIRARPAFEAGGDYLGAEWWHFQWEEGLVAGVSTFGGELQKIYSKKRLASSPPWAYRDYVWKKNWN